jgi:6,7-dimethyl-8-ribityllumazine synthase
MATTLIFEQKIELNYPEDVKIAIVASCWNANIMQLLINGAIDSLHSHGIAVEQITVTRVPGAFELPLGAAWALDTADACIALGCVVKGETRHDEIINHAIAKGITDLMLATRKPVGFGVLTTETQAQAADRAGGAHGNKGKEAAEAVLSMLMLNGK